MIFEGKSIFFHQIISPLITWVGCTITSVMPSVIIYSMASVTLLILILSRQKFCHDHFAGPGTINLIIGELFTDTLFNHIDGLFAGIRKLVPKLTTRMAFLFVDIRFVPFINSIISSVCVVYLY